MTDWSVLFICIAMIIVFAMFFVSTNPNPQPRRVTADEECAKNGGIPEYSLIRGMTGCQLYMDTPENRKE